MPCSRRYFQISVIRIIWHSPDPAHLHVIDSAIWWEHHNRIFENAIVKATNISSNRILQILPQIRQEYLDPVSWTVYADVLSSLSDLSSAGWKHVILFNHVPELSDLIESLGLADYFEKILTSARIGYEKPNRMAFDAIIKLLPSNSKLWMIGDSYTADVLGANNANINAILVRKKTNSQDILRSLSTRFEVFSNQIRVILKTCRIQVEEFASECSLVFIFSLLIHCL
ncbi:HAD-IA family hydrolase [bacterium]|nr:HAD-IA family hydrolase [bacterium]